MNEKTAKKLRRLAHLATGDTPTTYTQADSTPNGKPAPILLGHCKRLFYKGLKKSLTATRKV